MPQHKSWSTGRNVASLNSFSFLGRSRYFQFVTNQILSLTWFQRKPAPRMPGFFPLRTSGGHCRRDHSSWNCRRRLPKCCELYLPPWRRRFDIHNLQSHNFGDTYLKSDCSENYLHVFCIFESVLENIFRRNPDEIQVFPAAFRNCVLEPRAEFFAPSRQQKLYPTLECDMLWARAHLENKKDEWLEHLSSPELQFTV